MARVGMGQSGHDWWRWTDGHGKIQVVTVERGDIRIRGDIYSIRSPNRVDILVNGERVATWDISWDFFKAFEPVMLHLEMGQNRIEFVSQKPAVYIPSDSRPLAFAVRNLRVDGPTATPCASGNASKGCVHRLWEGSTSIASS